MPSVQLLTDTPDEVILSAGKATSQVQIAKTGKFKDPRYGNFAITLTDFSKWIANFNMLHRNDGRLGLPVDVDHAPEKKGETEAAGWITALSIKSNELWATVEWNDLGKDLVGNRRYAYLSPSYVHDFKDEEGKSHGTALVGVGLTNRPFLTMATVSLSKQPLVFAEEETSYTPESMPDFSKIAVSLGLAADADEATILAKSAELTAEPAKPVSLETQASAEGKRVLSVDEYASLIAGATAGAEAAKQLSQMRFTTAFDKSNALPAQRESFELMFAKDEELTLKVLEGLPQVVNMTPQGANGGAGVEKTLSAADLKAADGAPIDDERLVIHNKALQLAAAENIDYEVALDRVIDEVA